MLHKTKGVVLRYFKYRDTSIIIKIFTESFGLQSYIVNGVFNKKSKHKIALFQPLNLLDLVVYKKNNVPINRISEIKCSYPFKTTPYHISKSSIALFISEILYKTIKEEDKDSRLFSFIYSSLVCLDQLEENFENFHLMFLLKLSKFCGFEITNYQNFIHPSDEQTIQTLEKLIGANYLDNVKINASVRKKILYQILSFYNHHVGGLGDIKSIKILSLIFSEK